MDFTSLFDYPNRAAGQSQEEIVFLPNQNDEKWVKLLTYTETRRFRAGEVVIRLGETDRALYLITQGSLEVLIPHGGRQNLRRFTQVETGSVIGEQAFLDGKPRSATVRALTDCELLRLSFESFEALAAREPELARTILFDLGRLLSLRLRRTSAFIATWTS